MMRLISKILYIIVSLVETLIAIRIVFVFIGAHRTNTLASHVYNWSEYFVNPFRGIIVDRIPIGQFTIDSTALLALIVYMILAFIFVEMINVFSPPRHRE